MLTDMGKFKIIPILACQAPGLRIIPGSCGMLIRAEKSLDNYFGKVNYSLNGVFQMLFGTRDALSDSLLIASSRGAAKDVSSNRKPT